MGKKIKKVLIMTGLITLMTLGVTGCSQGSPIEASAPVQTETTTEADLDIRVNVPTTEIDTGNETIVADILETDGEGGFTGKTEDGEVIVSMGRYGEYGKEVYDVLVSMWLSYELEAEEDLREAASSLLGSISKENYEAIIAEILAMDRGQNPNANAVTQSQPAPTQSETKASVPTQSAPQSETKASAPTQSAPAETQASVQPTQPAPEDNNSEISKEEADRIMREAFGEPVSDPSSKVEIVDPGSITGGGDGSEFNWK